MDNIAPIVIAIIAFVIKIVSDSNKKQEQARKQQGQYKPSQQGQRTSGTSNPYPTREPYSYDRKEGSDPYNWEKETTSDNNYRSLDPKLVPVAVPNIDYDKLTNVSVTPSSSIPIVVVERRDNAQLISVKSKLRQKDSFRELYLLSEILNKPKALRKWPRSIY